MSHLKLYTAARATRPLEITLPTSVTAGPVGHGPKDRSDGCHARDGGTDGSEGRKGGHRGATQGENAILIDAVTTRKWGCSHAYHPRLTVYR